MSKSTCGIYGLVDPRTDLIRYVGQSVDIDGRYEQHVDTDFYCGNLAKRKWIKELKMVGLLPRLVVLATCLPEHLDELERAHITRLHGIGSADLNINLVPRATVASNHTVQIEDDLWNGLVERARAEHTSISRCLNTLLKTTAIAGPS